MAQRSKTAFLGPRAMVLGSAFFLAQAVELFANEGGDAVLGLLDRLGLHLELLGGVREGEATATIEIACLATQGARAPLDVSNGKAALAQIGASTQCTTDEHTEHNGHNLQYMAMLSTMATHGPSNSLKGGLSPGR